jgi:hypothetical protein
MHVDAELFGQHATEIRCAVLSPDGWGATYYGPFAVALREDLVASRTSLLEDNPFNVELSRVKELLRAIWDDRAQLAVVRYGDSVSTSDQPIAALIRVVGPERTGQSFIEAHIWGTFTRGAFKKVVAHLPPGASDPGLVADATRIEDLCGKASIPFERVEDPRV